MEEEQNRLKALEKLADIEDTEFKLRVCEIFGFPEKELLERTKFVKGTHYLSLGRVEEGTALMISAVKSLSKLLSENPNNQQALSYSKEMSLYTTNLIDSINKL